MADKREIDQITVAIRECVRECQESKQPRETIEKYLLRLRRRGWPEENVQEVEESVAGLLDTANKPPV